jgi:uncharacterized protein YcbX
LSGFTAFRARRLKSLIRPIRPRGPSAQQKPARLGYVPGALRQVAAAATSVVARRPRTGDWQVMSGRIAALYRHPVKGFTPERLDAATLEARAAFPCDRLYAVENGPSGFDGERPAFLPKTKFTVLASIPALARARTRYDEATGVIRVEAEGQPALAADLTGEPGRAAFAAWLERFIDVQDRRGSLRVLQARGAHRFMDDQAGAVSLLNLASVRDLETRLGRPVDPLRFRANIHVEGWAPWAELGLDPGAEIRLGEARAAVVKPIVRCAATHVDPATGERDIDLVPALHQHYGRLVCGVYLQVAWGGTIRAGDPAAASVATPAPSPAPPQLPVRVT